jgi:tetratricopeptide (TPR) repeat protein
MRTIYLLTFFLLFSHGSKLFCQVAHYFSTHTYLDYQDKMRYYINANTDSVTIHCANMRKTRVAEYIVYAHAAEAYFHYISGNTDLGKKQLALAYKNLGAISNTMRRIELEATVLNFEGSIYKHYKNYKAAARKYIQGQQLARLLEDKSLEIRFIHNLADIKARLGELPEAIRETKMGLSLLESNRSALTEENYQFYKFNTFISLGKFYSDRYDQSNWNSWLDSAQNYYQSAFRLCSKNTYNYALIQLNMGGISMTKKDYKKSIRLFEEGLSFFSANGVVVEQKKAVYNLAIAHYELKAYPKH